MLRARRSSSRSAWDCGGTRQYQFTACSKRSPEPSGERDDRRMSLSGPERKRSFIVLETSPGRSSARAKL